MRDTIYEKRGVQDRNKQITVTMALFEATNTLLDFDMLQNSCDLSLSPLSPISSSFSSENSVAQWTASSDDDEGTMTSLTNASLDQFRFPEILTCAAPFTAADTSMISSSSGSGFSDAQLEDLDVASFTSGFEAGSERPSLSDDMQVSSTAPSKENYKKSKRKKEGSPRVPRSTSANNKLPPCRICADAASGFHYGVNSCEACKRFFRRALKRKRNFKCRGNKNCVIKGKKNNLCGYCRYKSCLALGMSKNAIKTGRYTHEKRAQDFREVQRLVSDNCLLSIPETEVMDVVQKLMACHSKVITSAYVPEKVMLKRAQEKLDEFQLKKEMFGIQETLSPEQYDEVFQVTGLDLDERKAHMQFVARAIDRFAVGYVQFGKGIPGFDDLSLNDQANLLKLARCEVWFLGAFRGFLKDHDIFYAPNGDCKDRWEMDRLLGEEYMNYAFFLSSYLKRLNLSHEEVVLLKSVCLTFTDRCVMEDPTKVEEVQWRMLKCLMYLLSKNHADPNLFYKVINWAVAARNLTELSRKALSNTHFAEAIRSNAVLVDMILI